LSYFRQWIQTEAAGATNKDMLEVKAEVEAKLAESQRQVFLKYLDPRGAYMSLAETIVGVGIDALVSGAGAIIDLMRQRSKEKQKQGLRWQAFILQARATVSDV